MSGLHRVRGNYTAEKVGPPQIGVTVSDDSSEMHHGPAGPRARVDAATDFVVDSVEFLCDPLDVHPIRECREAQRTYDEPSDRMHTQRVLLEYNTSVRSRS